MKKDRRSGEDRRVADVYIPHEERRVVEDDIEYIVHHLDGAKEHFEERLAKLQQDSYFLLVKPDEA